MNIPKGYKLVPIEPTSEMVLAGINTDLVETGDEEFDQQEDYRRVWRSMVEDAPTPTQSIYDEAKERELFEAYCAKVGLPIDTLPSGEYLIPATRFMSQGWHARAKAGENE